MSSAGSADLGTYDTAPSDIARDITSGRSSPDTTTMGTPQPASRNARMARSPSLPDSHQSSSTSSYWNSATSRKAVSRSRALSTETSGMTTCNSISRESPIS